MKDVGISDSIFKSLKDNAYYDGTFEYGDNLGDADNLEIIGKDENIEFYKKLFIQQIKDETIIDNDEFEVLEQNALFMRRVDNSIGYEKFKQQAVGVLQNYVGPAVQVAGGSLEIVAATGVEVVGCGSVVACIPATALAATLLVDGSDNVVTGLFNIGKAPEEQTTSYTLTQVYGLSEADALKVKLAAGGAGLGGELAVAVNVGRASANVNNLYQNAKYLDQVHSPAKNIDPQPATNSVAPYTIDAKTIKNNVVADADGLFRSENGSLLTLTNTMVKDSNGVYRVFKTETGVPIVDLPKGTNLQGEVQYVEYIGQTLPNSQNSSGLLDNLLSKPSGNQTNSSALARGWTANNDGTFITNEGIRVTATNKLYTENGQTFEVFNRVSDGRSIVVSDGKALQWNGAYVDKSAHLNSDIRANTIGDGVDAKVAEGKNVADNQSDGLNENDWLIDDNATSTGHGVHYNEHSTAIGDDSATIGNFNKVNNSDNGHNVIVHGNLEYDEIGGIPVLNSNATVPVKRGRESDAYIPLSVEQVAEAVKMNPNYVQGTPVCFGSCWSGSSGTAQHLANELGAPVYAPTRPVAWDKDTSKWVMDMEVPEIDIEITNTHIKPEWKMFYPEQ